MRYRLKFKRLQYLLKKITKSKNYHLYEKWELVYMIYNINNNKLRFGDKYNDSIFIASFNDLKLIQSQLYPKMNDKYDQKYFKSLGEKGIDCFLCKVDGSLIHYSWLFYDITKSPLVSTPLDINLIGDNVVMWGPTFTIPESRGMIYPYIFSKIVRFLREKRTFESIIIYAHSGNKGAIPYYKNLGFQELSNQPRPNILIKTLRLLDFIISKVILNYN